VAGVGVQQGGSGLKRESKENSRWKILGCHLQKKCSRIFHLERRFFPFSLFLLFSSSERKR
jgi:hypothetical protein